MKNKELNPARISFMEAYELICTSASDKMFRNAIKARGWLNYPTFRNNDNMVLTDGSLIYQTRDGIFRVELN